MHIQRSHTFFLRGAATLAIAACLWFPAAPSAIAQDTASTQQQTGRSDADIQSDVAYALLHDPTLQNQQVSSYTAHGEVTLSGTVQTQQQRQQAETVAASVDGVGTIRNNIVVSGQDTAQADTAPPPPDQTAQADQQVPPPPPDQSTQTAQAGQTPPPPPPDQTPARAPYQGGQQGYYGNSQQPYNNVPPQPPSGPVTVPAGTLLQIRTSEPLDTAHTKDGTAFQATAANNVYVGNVLAIPRGAVLQGTVVHSKNAGPLGGSADLQLQINSLSLGSNNYTLASDTWSSKGPNKAGYTAGNTVGGAAVGAIIGGILGRGAGAAIGAGAGAAAGLAGSAATNGPRLYLPVESLLNFHLSTPVTVQPVSWQEAQRLASNVPQLRQRPVYMAPRPYGYAYPYPYPYYYGGYYVR
jgi:hypothetical protein